MALDLGGEHLAWMVSAIWAFLRLELSNFKHSGFEVKAPDFKRWQMELQD